MSVPAPRVKYSPPSVPAVVSPNPVAWRALAPGTSIRAGMSSRCTCIGALLVVVGVSTVEAGGCSALAGRLVGNPPCSGSSGTQPAARAELGMEHVLAPEDLAGRHGRVRQRDLQRGLGEV